ncbi:hypothetical protein AEAC466_20390 [Asticcacaulis sp. AC466]|uniref:AraC family transcriptional regulator n=1 Tax=Asticcacaulis sp. AC466 TaxID=1282362 RepID=UPI0003C3C584|nr:helix-turn-helix domain-containing protein [Asticcacaulis sp. AC466]ESQ81784.1 hypothetical protein AEAC466_20390 [Asticcacaulis sp. AC466]
MIDPVLALDLLLRGGACTALVLVVAVILRDHGRLVVARLAAAFAAGGVAHAIAGIPGVSQTGLWNVALVTLATGNNLVFWLLARRLFDDGFRLRPWYGAVWMFIVLLQIANQIGASHAAGIGRWVAMILTFQAPLFAVLAAAQTIVTWRGDLVEPRRRLRAVIVSACAVYIILSIGPDMAGTARDAADTPNLILASGLLAIAMLAAWLLLGVRTTAIDMPFAVKAPVELTANDRHLLARLDSLMTIDRLYRQDGLTVAALAHRLGLPEYRLRRLINQGLGHRNFAAFINGWRIGDARQALDDPTQDAVPILTIALDAGFASLGPFNRAFKAMTGLTPSDYRARRASKSADRISKSA